MASLVLSSQIAGNYTWQVNYTVVPLIQNVKRVEVNLQNNTHGRINITEAFNLNVLKSNTTVFFKLLDTSLLQQHFKSLVVQIVISDGDKAVVTLPLKHPEEIVNNATLPKDAYNVDVWIKYVTENVTAEGAIQVAIWASEENMNQSVSSPKAYYVWSLSYKIA